MQVRATLSGVTDAAGNAATTTGSTLSFTVTYDAEGPGVVLSLASGVTPPVNDVFDVILTFDTVVRGFDAADIRVQNGTATALTGSGTLYTVTITPDGTSAIVISVDLTGVTDSLGNAGTSTETLTVAYYDDTPPAIVGGFQFAPNLPATYPPGSVIEVQATFDKDNVRYTGNPPYILLAVGASERRAYWTRAEDTNSTLVTFAYTVSADDNAPSVNLIQHSLTIPVGSDIVDGDGNSAFCCSQSVRYANW